MSNYLFFINISNLKMKEEINVASNFYVGHSLLYSLNVRYSVFDFYVMHSSLPSRFVSVLLLHTRSVIYNRSIQSQYNSERRSV